jgi:anaerobic magnesium-protoporphyrin IX monomethyl ester cyclase
MKLLFINPSLRRSSQKKIFPLGLASVMTYVKHKGYDFDLLDVDLNNLSDEHVESFLKDRQYDVILYGTLITQYKWIKWLTHTIKRLHPSTKIVIGNSVAASCLEVFMKNAPADIVVIGEGEISCGEILDTIRDGGELSNVAGIAYRDTNGSVVKNPARPACDINQLPMVDWSMFDVPEYLKRYQWTAFGIPKEEKAVVFPVSSSRGCTFRCTFCHFVFWDDTFRHRTPESIVDEVRRNIEQYGVTYINFNDDLTLASLAQAESLADGILASGLKFQWNASVRTDLFGKPKYSYEKRLEVAKKLKASGCMALNFSLESANEEILEMMKKYVKKEYFSEQIQVLKEAEIMAYCSVVFGYPQETKETIQETFDLCLKNRMYPSVGFLMPLPYTEMYEYAKEHGFITDEDEYLDSITERQDICLNMTKMSDDEIMGQIKKNALELNKLLELGLDESSLVKTGGARNHTNLKTHWKPEDDALDPEDIKRNESDFSFNYSQTAFDDRAE